MKLKYTGRRIASFKERGPVTHTRYRVPGKGLTFYADPRDVNGTNKRKGFKDWPGYEVA